jgi:hypothetical protein
MGTLLRRRRWVGPKLSTGIFVRENGHVRTLQRSSGYGSTGILVRQNGQVRTCQRSSSYTSRAYRPKSRMISIGSAGRLPPRYSYSSTLIIH